MGVYCMFITFSENNDQILKNYYNFAHYFDVLFNFAP